LGTTTTFPLAEEEKREKGKKTVKDVPLEMGRKRFHAPYDPKGETGLKKGGH